MPTTSDKADVTINNSFRLAQKYNHEYLTTEHLMYGILSDEHIVEFLEKKDINAKNISEALITYIENDLVDIIKQDVNKPKKTLTIDRIFQRAFAQAEEELVEQICEEAQPLVLGLEALSVSGCCG